MRKLRLRVAKQFAQSPTTSSWQHSNLNQDSLASKSIVLNEGTIGRIDLPGSLVTSDYPPETLAPHPSRNVSLLNHTANAVVYISTLLPSEHFPCPLVVGGPCDVYHFQAKAFHCHCQALQGPPFVTAEGTIPKSCSISLGPTKGCRGQDPSQPTVDNAA